MPKQTQSYKDVLHECGGASQRRRTLNRVHICRVSENLSLLSLLLNRTVLKLYNRPLCCESVSVDIKSIRRTISYSYKGNTRAKQTGTAWEEPSTGRCLGLIKGNINTTSSCIFILCWGFWESLHLSLLIQKVSCWIFFHFLPSLPLTFLSLSTYGSLCPPGQHWILASYWLAARGGGRARSEQTVCADLQFVGLQTLTHQGLGRVLYHDLYCMHCCSD